MWQRKSRNSKAVTPPEPELLRSKASAYCALTEHCTSEVRTKLAQWGASPSLADEIIDWLIDEDFISEARYCRAFVADKIRFQGWGKSKIRLALREKRLPADLISAALDAFPTSEYLARLQSLYLQKARSLQHSTSFDSSFLHSSSTFLPPEEAESTPASRALFQQKLLRFLASRGFSYSDISAALSSLPAEDSDSSSLTLSEVNLSESILSSESLSPDSFPAD